MKVCSEQDVMKAVAMAKENFGKLDVVVNCAGKFKKINFKRETEYIIHFEYV